MGKLIGNLGGGSPDDSVAVGSTGGGSMSSGQQPPNALTKRRTFAGTAPLDLGATNATPTFTPNQNPDLPPDMSAPMSGPIPAVGAQPQVSNTPSFLQALNSGPGGMPNALSSGLSTKGKILSVILAAAKGGLAGEAAGLQGNPRTGYGGFGAGYETASQLPFIDALQKQRVQQGQIQQQVEQAQIQNIPAQRAQHAATLAQTQANTGKDVAQTTEANARADALRNPPAKNPAQLLTEAVNDAVSQGRDPNKDPKVRQLSDVITGLQRQPGEKNDTEVTLATKAAQGDPNATRALKILDQSKLNSRPVVNVMTGSDVKDIADAIQNGDQPPTTQGLYRNSGPVRAELARRGVPLAKMETDWKATQKFMGTLNGPQQTRLRQDISVVSDSLDKVEGLYNEWKQLAPQSGYRVLNKATLLAMKNVPGRAGAVATALDAQIADTSAGLGTIYMGGNSPTDHSLSLAQKSLSAEWNEVTFEEALKQARANVKIRQNSLTHSQAAGVSANSPYTPNADAGAQAAPTGQAQVGTPQTHVFSPSAWKRVNPQGDVNAAIKAAQQQGFQVNQ